jgi:transcriptional regulator with XRE-family HTH domain
MKTGEVIKSLRKKCGWNQTELGEKIGMTYGGIAAIEQGRNDPSIETVRRLSELFNVSTDYIIKGTESENTITDNEQEIISVLRTDPEITQSLIEMAKLKKKVVSYARQYKTQHLEIAA